MPLPPSVTLIPVHMKVLHTDAAGTPARGRVTFAMPYTLRDAAGAVLLGRTTFKAKLDVNGEATIQLPATDDPDLAPLGWAYTVTPDTDAWRDPPFPLEVPVATVGTFELAAHAPAVTPTAVATYALLGHTHTLDNLSDVDVAAATNGQVLGKVAGVWTGVAGGSGSAPDATTTVKGLVKLAGDLGGTADLPTVPALAGKAPTIHTHTAAQITDLTTAVNALIAAVIDAAPASLDTLNELAAALGDDPNFATTVTTLIGTKQPADSDLTAIAALTPSDNDLLQRIAGAWAARTPAQVKTSLALVKADVGLSAVDNTSDANKPVSTATQAALDGKIAAGLLDAKGDLIAASAADTPARVAVGSTGQILASDSSQTAGLRWVVQDRAADPLDIMYGLLAANGNPLDFRDPSPTGTNGWWSAIFVPAGAALTTCWCAVHTAGTIGAGGENGFAVYDVTGAQIGSTPSDDTLFGSTGPRSKNLSAPIAASTSRRVVFVELRREGWSVEPSFAFLQTASGAGLFDGGWPAGIRKSFIAGGTGHPASITPATHGSSGGGYMPFMGFS